MTTGGACGTCTVAGAGAAAAPENSMLESCSWRRAVCCLSASVSGAAEGGAGGGGTIAGEADLTSKRESRFETDAVAGTPEVLAGSRMEACASDARGESKSADSGAAGFTGAGFTENCGAADTGATGTTGTAGGGGVVDGRYSGASGSKDAGATGATGTTGGGGVVDGKYSGASGSKDVDQAEESGATGAAGVCTTEIGTTGFAATVLGVPLPFA